MKPGIVGRVLVILAVGILVTAGVVVARRFGDVPDDEPSPPVAITRTEEKLPEFPAPVVAEPPSQAYAGSESCVECHSEISDTFRTQHPMGRSVAKATEAIPLEEYGEAAGFTEPQPPGATNERRYYPEQTGEGVLHHETLAKTSGESLYDLSVPIAYTVGSGQRGRSYLINRDGLLFMSPLTWYAGKERWDLSPGYAMNNLHFSRRIVDGCLSCHVGRVAAVDTNRYEPEPFHEESISCERCHGPSQDHVDHWRTGGAEADQDPILKIDELAEERQNHICYQCHLVGEHRVPRYGRSDFDFRPGDHIADIWTLFLQGTGVDNEDDPATDAVSQVEQMLSSTCYRRSDGALGCVSCHDPHLTPATEERVDFYRTRCLNCHGPSQTQCSESLEIRHEATSEDSCIQCHMAPLAAKDVPHTSQTDHRILRVSQTAERLDEAEMKWLVFGEDEGIIPTRELERAQLIFMVRMGEDLNDSSLAVDAIPSLEGWLKVVPNDFEAAICLGTAYFMIGDLPEAERVWERALEQHPTHEELLRRLFMLNHQAEQLESALAYGRRLTRVNPWNYEYWGRLAHILGQLGYVEEGIAAAERAAEINPSTAIIHQWLADAYQARGDAERSRQHRVLFQELSR